MGDLYQNLKATGIRQDQAVQNMRTTIGAANEEKRRAKEALNKAKNAIPQDPAAVQKAQADYSAASAKAAETGVQAAVGDWSKMSTEGYGSGVNAQDAPSGQSTGSQPNGSDNQAQSGGSSGNQSQAGGSTDHSQQFSKSFYDAVGRAVKGAPQGNTLDAASATAKEQAQNQRNESANRQMEAQKSQQIADRNEFAEAGKIASVQNDAQNRQNIANKEGLSGAAAAMQRATNAPDVTGQQARQDQQRNVANQRREEADAAQQGATESEGQSMQFKIKSRDYNEDTDTEDRLSKGNGTGEEVTETGNETVEEEQPQPQEQEEPVADEEPEAEEETPDVPNDQPDEPQEDKPEDSGTTWQNVMNYLTYGNDPTSGWNKGTKPGFTEAKKYAESKGWAPINASQAEFDGDLSHLQDLVKQQQPNFYDAWQGGSGRVGEGGKQINRGDAGDEVIDSTEINSDERIKNLRDCLSDARMKWIKEDWDTYGKPSPEDWEWLCRRVGPFMHNDKEYSFDSEDYDESVLSAYADNIRNYVYNYKEGAEQIDPRNDPSVEHIGPMAQDIEQVNPALIHENSQGIKSVDTARLAMMNAGAIGDLARALKDIDERLKRLGV